MGLLDSSLIRCLIGLERPRSCSCASLSRWLLCPSVLFRLPSRRKLVAPMTDESCALVCSYYFGWALTLAPFVVLNFVVLLSSIVLSSAAALFASLRDQLSRIRTLWSFKLIIL